VRAPDQGVAFPRRDIEQNAYNRPHSMKKTFYIIDGHAHIFRAYFAPFRDLTSPTGEPTKATYVFTQMLINLIEQRKPDYLAMVIDSGDETVFRKEIYPDYKANRPPVPADFHPQEDRILRIVKDAGVPLFEKPGFEADDLIATMADKLCNAGFDVYLVSKDKDLRQLLTDCIHMYDVQGDEVIDIPKMRAKLGYGPENAVNVQTLIGDAIDNVPGIPGVGEKTAVKLLNTYGSVEAILDNIDKLTPKMKENFLAHKDKLSMSRQLVTLKRDVEFDWSIEGCAFRGLNAEGLKKHLLELNFRGLLSKVSGLEKASETAKAQANEPAGLFDTVAPAPVQHQTLEVTYKTSEGLDYQCVDTVEKLETLAGELRRQSVFAFDTETDNLRACDANIVGMSFSFAEGTGFYVPVKGPLGAKVLDEKVVLDVIKPILEDESIGKVGHNIKYDLLAMLGAGVSVRGVRMDTMVASFLLDASKMQYGIDRLAIELLHFKKIPTVDLIGSGKKQITMDQVDLGTITRYASEDADITFRLHQMLAKKLAEYPAIQKLHDDVETPLIEVLTQMECRGIAIDPKILREQSAALGERIEKLRDQIFEAAGESFNIDSPKQLASLLFEKLKLKSSKKTKTGYSTDIEVLERLASEHPVPKLVLEYRQLVKLKGTYLDALTDHQSIRDGKVHTSFNQTGAATGRLSSSDPNLQNIPIRTDEGRRIRLAFVPSTPSNVLLTADYSQIELRMLAHLSEEPALMTAFKEGIDIHTTVASEVFGVALDQVSRDQRNQAKIINFGIIYGVTAQGLARRIDGMDVVSAGNLITAYNKRFPRIAQFMNECVQKAKADGYVETITGRRRPLPDINSGVINIRNMNERMAINSVVQGSAADLIKIAMVNIHRAILAEARPLQMLLQVHDELVFETPETEAESQMQFVRQMMTGAMQLKVPLEVESGYGKNWQEVK
jgi:DNA polymerase I